MSNPHLAPPTPPPPPSRRMPYYPPVSCPPVCQAFKRANWVKLPWFSFNEGTFPSKSPRRRRRKPAPQSSSDPVELPARDDLPDPEIGIEETQQAPQDAALPEDSEPRSSTLETPLTSHAPSEEDSTQPTTPSSITAQVTPQSQINTATKTSSRPHALPLPIIPVIPNFPLASKAPKRPSVGAISEVLKPPERSNEDHLDVAVEAGSQIKSVDAPSDPEPVLALTSPSTKPAHKSWADLVRTKAQPKSSDGNKIQENGIGQSNGFTTSKITSLAEALSSYNVDDVKHDAKISFLEPRGLVNTGNMCYMNSVC